MLLEILRSVGALPGLHRAQWLSPQALRELQWTRFRSILHHAARHSPFYRRRFAEAGVDPDRILHPEDLPRIPITTREDLRRGQDLVADDHDPAALHRSITSGSTGQRTVSYFDPHGWIIGKYLLKGRARLACGVRPWDRIALFQESPSNDAVRRHVGRQVSYSIHQPPEEILDAVRRYAPTVFYGFPSYLMRLAEVSRGSLRPRRIFTSGEFLDSVTRREIEQAFGASVFDVYGCTEMKEIAWQCPEKRGYHVNADWVLVESVPLEEQEQHRPNTLLVTCLYNRGMPLLRYRLGDTGTLSEDRCACGRGLPLMAPSLGRQVDYLRLPDGSEVSPYSLTCAIEPTAGLLQYQIVQESVDRVLVKVVPGPEFGVDQRRKIVELLAPILCGVRIDVQTLDRIDHEPSGKYRIVRSAIGRAPEVAS
jgi:phenylacetate-CoA ligase